MEFSLLVHNSSIIGFISFIVEDNISTSSDETVSLEEFEKERVRTVAAGNAAVIDGNWEQDLSSANLCQVTSVRNPKSELCAAVWTCFV